MAPRIWLHKGFVMIDPADNVELINQLNTSKFLSRNPMRRNVFYFMVNNLGLAFYKRFEYFFSSNFKIEDEVKELMGQDEINYIERREEDLDIVKLKGITYKDHQVRALELMSRYKQLGIFLGPGTGKTIISIGIIASIAEDGLYVIVTPKKAIGQYLSEVRKHMPEANAFEIRKEKDPGKGIRIGVINYESASHIPDEKLKVLILDESHRVKNPSARVSKIVSKIESDNTYLLSGTPQDKARFELFSQFKILNDDLMSVKYLFLERFFYLDDYFNPTREKRPRELEEIMVKVSYGDKTENLLDLPDEEEIIVECTMTDEVREIYNTFKNDKVLEWGDKFILGDVPAKHRTKLSQIASGFIYDEEDGIHRMPTNPKEEKFIETLEKTDNAIIFFTYTEEMKIITEILDRYNKNYGCVSGQTKLNEETTEDFKNGLLDYLVIQIQSGNAALDFPMVSNVIYYSLHDSYIFFEQSRYRIRRIGQTEICRYYYLLVKGSVERGRFRSVKNKKSFNDSEYAIYSKEES